jgi:hypothetical protein
MQRRSSAVDEVAATATVLIRSLTTNATPRDRQVEAEKARVRSAERFRLKLPD